MYFFIQIDTSSFAEFEISEFEISRVDCTVNSFREELNLIKFTFLATEHL